MKKLAVALILLVAFIQASASNSQGLSPLIQNVPGRQTQNLDGLWKSIVDIYELGYYNYRMDEDRNGWFRDAKAQRPEDPMAEYLDVLSFNRKGLISERGIRKSAFYVMKEWYGKIKEENK